MTTSPRDPMDVIVVFKIVKSATLAALRMQATQLPALHQQLVAAQERTATAQQETEKARAETQHAQAELQALMDDKVAGLTTLRDAANDPVRGPSVRGQIAVRILRDQLEAANAEAAEAGHDVAPGLRFLGILLEDETDDVSDVEPRSAEAAHG